MIIEYANTLEDFDNEIISGEVEVSVNADNIQGINDWLDANVGNIYTCNFK